MREVPEELSLNRQVAQIVKGQYSARMSGAAEDIAAAQAFRTAHFGGPEQGVDCDRFDSICRHVLVEDLETDMLVACFRFQHLPDGAVIEQSYSAQYYDLLRLQNYNLPLLEIGRFCIEPRLNDPDILRISLAFLTRFVDQYQIGLMFGCASFEGTQMAPYTDAFALLKHRHLAPEIWKPAPRAPKLIPYAAELADVSPNLKQANATMPTLLRSYLAMGGWVSDHAVMDAQMDTLHVFTGVEIAKIPPARKRFLRADAG